MELNMIQVNLYISNFRVIGKRLTGIALTVMLLLCLYNGASFCIYVPATETNSRLSWNRYYSETDNIDSLLLGSSHVHSDINVELLNREDNNYFMFATAGQSIRDSYYVFKEVSRSHNIDDVYLELYFRVNVQEDIVPSWRILDYMKTSNVKFDYIYNICSKENFFDTIFPALRYRTAVFDLEQIRKNVTEKTSRQYCEYQSELFTEEGFMGSDEKLSSENFIYSKNNKWFDEDPLDEEADLYLRKFIEECQDKGINIHLFSSPITNLELLAIGNYDYYVTQINAIVAEYGIEYYDFNLCKSEYLPLDQSLHFRDTDHLNNNGVEIYTELFEAVVINSEVSKEEYFYTTYAEKKLSEGAKVWGIIRLNQEKQDETGCNFMLATSNHPEVAYKIEFWTDNGEYMLVQDYSENVFFSLPTGLDGICRIVMKDISGEIIQVLELDY